MPFPRQELDASFDKRIGAWFGRSKPITRDEMLKCVFRFNELPNSNLAFIDAVIPGHNRTLYGAIGGGTAEENLRSQVEMAENYHIDFIRAAPRNGAALHSHDSEETFICLTGKWKVTWGDNGEESITLGYLDGIAVPAGVMRSFENVSESEALMMAILGGKEPGHVVWSEAIHDKMAKAWPAK
jgi:mannose-6-phosphate isomerase-like protein (cupin superfamily)